MSKTPKPKIEYSTDPTQTHHWLVQWGEARYGGERETGPLYKHEACSQCGIEVEDFYRRHMPTCAEVVAQKVADRLVPPPVPNFPNPILIMSANGKWMELKTDCE